VRRQPPHSPLCAFIWHIDTHGDGTGDPSRAAGIGCGMRLILACSNRASVGGLGNS
jgi:hypothetical protein